MFDKKKREVKDIMEKETIIQVTFDSHETQILTIMKQHCVKNGMTVSEYIKDIIKKDLAWGHFTKRKRNDRKRRNR